MLGLSYGQILLILGATAAVIGPKELPIIARTAGKLAGRAIGYVQLARGQFERVMGQPDIQQMRKDMRDLEAQVAAIQHAARSAYSMNPGPLVRTVLDNPDQTDPLQGATFGGACTNLYEGRKATIAQQFQQQQYGFKAETGVLKEDGSVASAPSKLYSRATAYAKLAESQDLKKTDGIVSMGAVDDRPGLLSVLPVSAECAKLLPKRQGEVTGSDIVLEAIIEAEVAHIAKEFTSQPQDQIKFE